MKTIYIYHHLGLGDHIICNGLVRHFAETKKVFLLCKNKNHTNIKFMYRDNTNITVNSTQDDVSANNFCNNIDTDTNEVLRIGFAVGGYKYNDCLWDENFYRNANLNFQYSWSKFYIEPDLQKCSELYLNLNPYNEPYIFIHNIDSTNTDRINYLKIDSSKKIIKTDPNINFFDYFTIIQQASEIHCIDSSFKHLVDRIHTKGKLFYHKLKDPKTYDSYNSKKEWIVV